MLFYDLVVIGGGVSGISSAIAAKKSGVEKVVILEKDSELGGMINQCIHSGFGRSLFNEDLTGPELAQRFADKAIALEIEYKLNTMALEIRKDMVITAVNSEDGIFEIKGKSIIFAAGCMENTKEAVDILGSKTAGIYTAGTAQRIVNTEGFLPGKQAVIIGSGNLGLMMARTMFVEGAKVMAVIEPGAEPKGKEDYVRECVEDFDIPMLLMHKLTKVHGDERVESITIAEVDSEGKRIEGTEKTIECDTILLAVDLIPDTTLLKEAGIAMAGGISTDVEGIFVCGNANHIHEGMDSIAEEARNAGIAAARLTGE
ncbi:MAG: FAD-dependent pyridine nucleotide-disulfide oxidoreductase [Firmicutes bacterium]|nr:FAD-dependent pyridine nucleotide-disulfide oxidoreductase [Bacillota bacterium]